MQESNSDLVLMLLQVVLFKIIHLRRRGEDSMHHHLRPNTYGYGGYTTFISSTIITILDTWGHVWWIYHFYRYYRHLHPIYLMSCVLLEKKTRKTSTRNQMHGNWHAQFTIWHVAWLVKEKNHTSMDMSEIEMICTTRIMTLRWHLRKKT